MDEQVFLNMRLPLPLPFKYYFCQGGYVIGSICLSVCYQDYLIKAIQNCGIAAFLISIITCIYCIFFTDIHQVAPAYNILHLGCGMQSPD